MAEAIAGHRDKIFLATKASSDHHRPTDLIQAAEGSLRWLRTDWIDLYQWHRPNPEIPL